MYMYTVHVCTYEMYNMYRTCVSNVLFFLPWRLNWMELVLGFCLYIALLTQESPSHRL